MDAKTPSSPLHYNSGNWAGRAFSCTMMNFMLPAMMYVVIIVTQLKVTSVY